jgi:hypothetical protein
MTEALDDLRSAEQLPTESLYAEYRRLAAEQSAIRRLATLVASGVEPLEIFDAVTTEMCSCLGAETAGLWRFEADGEITILAGAADPAELAKWPIGTRIRMGSNTVAAAVRHTGRPARKDSYESATGPLAARIRAVGIQSAVGVPVVVDGRIWGMAAVGSAEPGPLPADTEIRISGFAELVASALVAGHREQQKRTMLGETSTRPFLIDSLLEGRVLDDWNVWEVANYLRLPPKGPFVVVAAHVATAGGEALPGIESKLRSLDAPSAWRLLPDLHVGIVHVKSDQQFDRIVGLMSRTSADRVGVSASFDDLRDVPHALHFAKVMLRNKSGTSSVNVFDGSILATAAVAAPDVMIRLVGAALASLGGLPDAEQEILFETFLAWQDNHGSVSHVADSLVCHPNTVRHRLRRIEKHTGRSLSRPRDVAELCLAFEVHRRLM